MNGFSIEEIKELVQMCSSCDQNDGGLSKVFEKFAKRHGRAKGSVRNFYYSLLSKAQVGDCTAKEFLQGTNLKASEVVKFTDKEEKELIRAVLDGKSKGKSVRRSITDYTNGDQKLALRYQNKYRNILAKKPTLITLVAKESEFKDFGGVKQHVSCKKVNNGYLYVKLKDAIDGLVESIVKNEREEIKNLKEEIFKLKEENLRLKKIAFNPIRSVVTDYYGQEFRSKELKEKTSE